MGSFCRDCGSNSADTFKVVKILTALASLCLISLQKKWHHMKKAQIFL